MRNKADTFGIPLPLLVAIAWQESRYNTDAIGKHGERGLFQIRDGAWLDAGDTLPPAARMPFLYAHDEATSTMYACRYIYWLNTKQKVGGLKTLDGIRDILQAYNGGVGNFKRGTVSAQAKRYADSVIKHLITASQLLGKAGQIS